MGLVFLGHEAYGHRATGTCSPVAAPNNRRTRRQHVRCGHGEETRAAWCTKRVTANMTETGLAPILLAEQHRDGPPNSSESGGADHEAGRALTVAEGLLLWKKLPPEFLGPEQDHEGLLC